MLVRVGHLRQVVPNALEFAWDMLVDGSDLDGGALEMEQVPAVVHCKACGNETMLRMAVMICEGCESSDVEVFTGEELQIVSMDVTLVEHVDGVH